MPALEQWMLEATPADVAHLLLSNAIRCKALAEHYSVPKPLDPLKKDLAAIVSSIELPVYIYYSKYMSTKGRKSCAEVPVHTQITSNAGD